MKPTDLHWIGGGLLITGPLAAFIAEAAGFRVMLMGIGLILFQIAVNTQREDK